MGPLDQATLNQFKKDFRSSSTPSRPIQNTNKKKGRFNQFGSSLISEGSGTGGALAGAALGTALLPGVGTLLGAGIGGALGGFGGRLAENKIRDDRFGLSEALTEGAISGVAGAGPLRLLKGAKAGVNAGRNGLAQALSTQADAAVKPVATAIDAPLKTSLSGKLDDFGNKQLLKNWGTLDTPTRKATNPAMTVKELSTKGINSSADAERIATQFTGTNGLVNKAVVRAVGEGTPVSTGGVRDVLDSSVINQNLSGLPQEKTARAFIESQLAKLGDNPKATDVFATMKRLEKQAADLEGAGGNYKRVDPTRADVANVYRDVRNHLQDALYKGGGVDKNLKAVQTPELRNQLLALKPNDAKWAKFVEDDIMGAKSVKALRKAQAPFVKGKMMVDNAADNAFSASGQIANSANGIRGAIIDGAANVIKKPFNQATGQAAKKLATVAPGATRQTTAGLAGALGAPTAGAIVRNSAIANTGEALVTPQAAEADSLYNELPTETDIDTDQVFNDEVMNDPAAQMQEQQASTDPFNPANAQSSVQKILANGGDMGDVKEYLSIVSTLQELNGGSNADAKINSTTATSLASSANGNNTLNQLESLFSQAGGGSGKIGGLLGNGLSKIGLNDNGQVYNDLAASSVSQLAKALNGGGQVSDTDAAVVIQALPKITDSPQVARAKFAALKARLDAAQQNTLQFGSGNNPEDLLSALNQ